MSMVDYYMEAQDLVNENIKFYINVFNKMEEKLTSENLAEGVKKINETKGWLVKDANGLLSESSLDCEEDLDEFDEKLTMVIYNYELFVDDFCNKFNINIDF